ncbi:MAG TPA: [Fe-Fe] hydrogenase large subunit C-terminal domain-containing protein [Bacteroidales bacterium]|nr:4Fe-4S binding protein [Bacteroidales bacterium]HPX34718.1 [Fe-Fe] hydrogenase large subunit C-terminal domain-containing protein [Bacteroidales bacterium]
MKDFHHALKLEGELCIGCSKCMNICPTQAIRVRNGKAILMPNRCIDCGECFRVCPVSAISIEQDDVAQIFNYKYRIALIPAVFTAQFPSKFSIADIYTALYELGFTDVFEVEHGAHILREEVKKIIDNPDFPKPLISTFCPAIVRLIQVKFPSLVHNLILLKPPLDISALYFRRSLAEEGVKEDEIGIFYFTQCAAKIAAIKSPAERVESPITGVINMDSAFNKVYQYLEQNIHNKESIAESPDNLSPEAILWSLTTGETEYYSGRRIAIDGVHNVISFLEKLENEENPGIHFLELRACHEGCAGGVLANENRFLSAERMRNRAKAAVNNQDGDFSNRINDYKDDLKELIKTAEVKPRSMLKLDENMSEAMRKMNLIRQIIQLLPMVDCGACGSPGCYALAEDIVQGRGMMENCIFIQRRYEQKGMLKNQDAIALMKKIWGENKFESK